MKHSRLLLLFSLVVSLCWLSDAVVMAQTMSRSARSAQHSAYADSVLSAFETMAADARAEYEAYEAQARADYEAYVADVKRVWGVDSIVENTPTTWVEYGDDYRSRSVVDFDKGTVVVEVAVDESVAQDSAQVDIELASAIDRLLNSRGTTSPYPSSVEVSRPLTNQPILNGLIDLSAYQLDVDTTGLSDIQTPRKVRPKPAAPTVRGGNLAVRQPVAPAPKPVSNNGKTLGRKVLDGDTDAKPSLTERRQEASAKAAEKVKAAKSTKAATRGAVIAKATPKKTSKVKGSDGKERKVVKVEMKLVSDNLSKSAAVYKDLVAKYSEKFQIEQPLIFAVIEQESRFNPEATSHIPAFGLMQLVPKSGGADAYRYVYGKQEIPTSSYLYDPEHNIELGTAYLRVLFNQFARVTNDECRRLCVIASYNTGAGNVSRAFIGSTKLSKAFDSINTHDYQGLYNYLTTRLAYEEARNYVSGVTKRREKYLKQ